VTHRQASARCPRILFPLLAFLLLLALGAPGAVFAQGGALSARTLSQLAAFGQDKLHRTPAQRKLDSHLIYAMRMSRRQEVVPGIASLPRVWNLLRMDAHGRVEVDIKAEVGSDLLALLAALGGQVEAAYPAYGSLRAWLPLAAVETAASIPAVHWIAPAATPLLNRAPGRAGKATVPLANIVSQGDHAHAADVVRGMGITGSGIKVGVLSDGVSSLAAEQAAGHLPAVTVLSGQAGSGDEGTAMLEIVHALAPNAQLYFATAFSGEAGMATNIQALKSAGCSVIVDDVTYFAEGVFEDGPVAQAVNAVTGGGALYFSSAANSGNKDAGTSGTWEGDFRNSGFTQPGVGTFHDFGGGATFNLITADTGPISLKWSDPLGGSGNDYDLYAVDGAGNVFDASTSLQDGSQDPFEIVGPQAAGEYVVAVLFSGAARALHLDTARGQIAINTAGNTFGHNAAGSALTVAAVDVATAGGNPFTGGGANPVEFYSSDGPRRIFYQPNGAALTPGNFLIATNGGQVLQKPDLAAADCVRSNLAEFDPFCGTSAAAPHAGAIAALAESMSLHPSANQVKACMLQTALDIMAPGGDRDSGTGIVMADRTIHCLQLSLVGENFYTLPPCRLVDTRNPAAPLGGPALQPNSVRSFLLSGVCGVPSDAKALSINVTITLPTAAGDLRLYPGDLSSPPLVSSINFRAQQTRSNNAILALSSTGTAGLNIKTDSAGTVQLILDVNGYFK
jgi:hypothetical protein